jgi:hypothetical protein
MEMPISMRITALKNKLISEINNAKLPSYILVPIVKDLYEQLSQLDIQNTQKDKLEYENSLKGEDNE